MSKALVIAEAANSTTLAIIHAASLLTSDITLMTIPLPNSSAAILQALKDKLDYDYILAPSSSLGSELLPKIAAFLNVAQISNVVAIINKHTFVQPIYGGRALATVESYDAIKVLTIRPAAFNAFTHLPPYKTQSLVVTALENSQIIKSHSEQKLRPTLQTAQLVIGGGRALATPENFALLEKLADSLQGAVGASRAAVDAGLARNEYQIGQTGQVIAPKLYLAFGISGAVQHIAGIKDSKIIVAINKDAHAPIMQFADFALLQDLFPVIEELLQHFNALDK